MDKDAGEQYEMPIFFPRNARGESKLLKLVFNNIQSNWLYPECFAQFPENLLGLKKTRLCTRKSRDSSQDVRTFSKV